MYLYLVKLITVPRIDITSDYISGWQDVYSFMETQLSLRLIMVGSPWLSRSPSFHPAVCIFCFSDRGGISSGQTAAYKYRSGFSLVEDGRALGHAVLRFPLSVFRFLPSSC